MKDTVKLACWLTFDQRGINKMYKNRPGLYAGEKAIQVNLTVPKAVFRDPDLIADIKIKGEPPAEFLAEVEADLREALDAIPHIHVSIPQLPQETDETS